jgi:glycosyltransferase involved in cell wall biosynthesis
MKIVFLGDARSIHFARWVRYFAERGHQVHTWSAEPPAEDLPNFLRLEPRFHWRPLLYPSLASSVKKKLTEIGPDLVNAHFVPNYGFLAALAGRRPLVISTWGSDVLISPRKSFLHKWRAQWALSKAKLVTADARVSAVELLYLKVNKDNILVRPFGVPRMLFERGEAKVFEKKKELTIFSCRQLEKLYDVETLLLALKRLKDKPNWRALILGTGSQRRALEKLGRKLGLQDRVSFLGQLPRADYERLMLSSDLYVSTALSDSTSVSLLEAMASKLACVVTEIPGNGEWIRVMENGLTFVPKQPKMLAFLLEKLADDFDLRIALANRAPEAVRQKGIWEENMAEVEAAFLKLVKKD